MMKPFSLLSGPQVSPGGSPCSCDTFVAFPPLAPDGAVIFGKNSDRPSGEGQSLRRHPASDYPSDATTKCTYIAIPQVPHTHAVLLSQLDWMFGAEMGANEHGLVIGNEAVWTVEPDESPRSGLVGMDLVRLGLERSRSAREAVNVVTNLLEKFGQCGPCAQDDDSFTYHNSFLMVDFEEAFVLETAGRHWVAERVTSGARNISNGLTIRTKYDLHSKDLHEYATRRGIWDGTGQLDFAKCFSQGPPEPSPHSRQAQGAKLMHQCQKGMFSVESMMDILRDHESGICMHGGFATTASMVTELNREHRTARHWFTEKPHPCQSAYLEETVDGTKK